MRPQEWQILSAYIDDQLSSKEKAALEARLEKEDDLQKALEELRQTKTLLRMLPDKRVPHNFTLSPDMVADRLPAASRLFPLFSLSSALATVLLVISIIFQWGVGVSPPAMQSAPATEMAAADEKAVEEEAPPAIILWGEQNYALKPVEGKGGSGGGNGNEPALDMVAMPTVAGPEIAESPIEEQLTAPEAESPQREMPAPVEEQEEGQPQAESLPAEESAAQLMEAAPKEPGSDLEDGTGPILGLPSEEEAGKIILPTEDTGQYRVVTPEEPGRLPLLQILLGGLALVSGAAAIFLHLKNRS